MSISSKEATPVQIKHADTGRPSFSLRHNLFWFSKSKIAIPENDVIHGSVTTVQFCSIIIFVQNKTMVDSSLWIFLLVQQMVDSTRSVFVQICPSLFLSFFSLSLFRSVFLSRNIQSTVPTQAIKKSHPFAVAFFRLQLISEDPSL